MNAADLARLALGSTGNASQDIKAALHMGQPGQPPLREWVMSFERTNLHLSVEQRSGGGAAGGCLAALIAEARSAAAGAAAGGGRGGGSGGAGGGAGGLEPTLVYALTTKDVDELAAYLQAQGVAAAR